MVTTITVGSQKIGPGEPCFIIAEAGVNHNGDLEMARCLVDLAAEAGADAVKFQTFRAEKVVSAFAPKAAYQLKTTNATESQLDMAKRLELPFEAFRKLSDYCYRRKILFISSPFDEESADFLAELDVPLFKIPSGEITNMPFLGHIAYKGKPMIVSTGMSTLEEVGAAVRVVEEAGNRQLVLLHCTSNYPTNPSDANLLAMQTMAAVFKVPVGYSDHTPGIEISLAAVALGACVIEKHFTLDRNLAGPDHQASLEPSQLHALVASIRRVESALGNGIKRPAPGELDTREVARRSIVAQRDLRAGVILGLQDVAIKRPGTGIPPFELQKVVGRKLRRNVKGDQVLKWEDLE